MTKRKELDIRKPKKKDLSMPSIDVPSMQPIEGHPLASLAGKYNDEPLWDDFMNAVKQYRKTMEEQEDTSE